MRRRPTSPEASFDLVFLCAALGEIPDRAAALTHCYRALKPGGTLSITEMFGDPHYQSRSVVAAACSRQQAFARSPCAAVGGFTPPISSSPRIELREAAESTSFIVMRRR